MDIVALPPTKDEEGKATKLKDVPTHQVKYIFPDLMCTSSMKWNFWVSSIKPIEIFVIPVTKQHREILLCKPVQPVFFLL